MTDYYVKPDGDDAKDGLSWANAWETVNKAATTITGGDTAIYADGTYDIGAGQTAWNSGSSGSIITHQADNSRLAIWENSTDTAGPLFGSVAMDGESYITLDGIRIRSGGYYTTYQIYLIGDSHHLEFNDCYLSDNADGHGIGLRYCHDVMIDGCLVSPESTTYGAREGITLGQSSTSAVDITIQNTEITKASHTGISIGRCDGVVIDNCVIHNVASHCIGMGSASDSVYVDDVEIKNCTLHDSGLWVSDDPSTHNKNGLYIAENCKNIEIHHNDIFNHGLAAVFVQSDADGPIYVYNNTCYNCNLWDAAWVGDGYGYIHFYYTEAQTPYLYVKNNIFYVTNQPRCRVYHVTSHLLTPYFVGDYNLFYAVSTEDQRIGNSGSYTTFQSYLDDGYEPNTVINDDPDFTNASNDDFTLLSISPAIDAGVDLGLGYPYYGDAPDIGAYEYEPLVPPIAVLREPGASLYKLRLYTAAGALIAEIVAFEELCYAKRINSPGLCTFRLDGDHTAIDQLEHRSQVEVWRANPDLQLGWHCDSYNLYLSPDRFQSERNVFTTVCPGQMWFLSTRSIAWYAATADRTKFTGEPAETIMKTLVDYNACANATTGNGRERNGAITGLSIQADGTNGLSLDWNCAWKNLLTELQDLAQVAGGDFDLIKTAAQAWEFRWYTGQRGNDRRGAIVFARERGNMINPRYLHDRMGEKTVAIVGGQNEKDQRDIVIRTGGDYSAANDVEIFVDARSRTTTAGYNAAGDKRLGELRAREEFSFEVVQTPSCFYGQVASGGDYELGDLVTARAFGIEKEPKIVGVTVTVVPAAEYCEAIDIEVETLVHIP